ncbi:hypothetical protein EC991_006372, partial [Linnemannia zychae]
LLFDSATTKYYVYVRWGETDYRLDGPHETVEEAKAAFQVTYHEQFGVQWEQRETTVSERFTYEVKTYETFETTEEIEEIVEETEAIAIVAREQEIETKEQVITTETTTTTTTTQDDVVLEHVTKDVIVDKKVEVDVDVSVEVDVEVEKKETKEIIITKETGKVEKPAVPKGTSWFRKIASATGAAVVGAGAVAVGAGALAVGAVHDAASGAGHAASGALTKVDGVWKRTVQVLTTRKAHVDSVAPIAKTSYVYYDDEVYDAVLVERNTGVTYVTQLLFDSATTKYYVYVRWGETDYRLDGPYETVEEAKKAFQVTYLEQFGVPWDQRETVASERFTYEAKTYETFETVDEVEEIVKETEAIAIITREQEIVTDEQAIATETTTTTPMIREVIIERDTKDVIVDKKVEFDVWEDICEEDGDEFDECVAEVSVQKKHRDTYEACLIFDEDDDDDVDSDADVSLEADVEVKETKETGITKVIDHIEKPVAPKGTSWFRKMTSATGAAVVGTGAVAVGAGAIAVGATFGAGHFASGALTKVDGVWKRTVQVLTTRKAHVDSIAPIAKTSYVYYDDEVYDAALVEKNTGVTYVTQLLFDSATTKYYVYVRWGETDYRLDGPYETVEEAKKAFQITYHEQFGVQWEQRETIVGERFTYEVKTYETFETTEEIEEIVEETEAIAIVTREQEIETREQVITTETTTTTTTTQDDVVLEHVTKDVIVDKKVEVDVDVSVEVDVEVEKPTVPKGTSWFRKMASANGAVVVGAGAVAVGAGALAVGAVHDAASGAGHAASGALTKVDGVWKRTVKVLTTRKAHADSVAPIAKTSYVYYDDEVYDAVLVEKNTGVTYVTQLLFDTATTKYYVYIRWSETDYRLDGPHETVEEAKKAFQVTYLEQFGVPWDQRETVASERFTYEAKTYETFETVDEVEEIVKETEAIAIITREQEIVTDEQAIATETTTTTPMIREVIIESDTKDVIADKKVEFDVWEDLYEEGGDEFEEFVTKLGVQNSLYLSSDVCADSDVDSDADVSVEADVDFKGTKEIVIAEETGQVEKPAISKGASWFHKMTSATGAAAPGAGAVAVGAGAIAVGATFGTGHFASGALSQVDGVWKRTVQVLTTRKAHVDSIAPIAKTSYVFYDDEVYDAVLVEKNTGITYVTQLLFEGATSKYYVFIHWGETDYKLDGPHETVEEAKKAFQDIYHEQFCVPWDQRETAASERYTYVAKTYETFETFEEVEEIIGETEAIAIITREQKCVTDEQAIATETTTTATTTCEEVILQHVAKDVIVDNEVEVDNVDSDNPSHTPNELSDELPSESLCELGNDEATGEVVDEVETDPSLRLTKYEISGLPESLSDLTTTSLVSEMRDSPIFDDESLGAMDLEEEQDILQFLIEQVHEDNDYTKRLLWTVYKSLTEGFNNQSTKNAACILERAEIQFRPQL